MTTLIDCIQISEPQTIHAQTGILANHYPFATASSFAPVQALLPFIPARGGKHGDAWLTLLAFDEQVIQRGYQYQISSWFEPAADLPRKVAIRCVAQELGVVEGRDSFQIKNISD